MNYVKIIYIALGGGGILTKRVYTLRAEGVYIACGEGGTHEEEVYFSCVNRAPNFHGASIFPVGYILSEFFRTGCHEF